MPAFIIACAVIIPENFISPCGFCYCPVSFQVTFRAPWGISSRAGLVVMTSLSFFLSGYVLISPSLLKDSFAGPKIPGW